MLLREVAEARVEATDRRERLGAVPLPFVVADQGVHGIADDCCHRAAGPPRQVMERPELIVSELHLHTYHVRNVPSPSSLAPSYGLPG